MQAYIQVKDDDLTNIKLPLDNTSMLSISFNASNLSDISKRSGNFSKTVNIQGTKEVNRFFSHMFNVNVVSGTYDRNKRVEAIVFRNNMPQFKGYIQLHGIVNRSTSSTNLYSDIVYEVTLRDALSTFYSDLGDKTLQDLDLSLDDHPYNVENIVGSFDHDWKDAYAYTLPKPPEIAYPLPETGWTPAQWADKYPVERSYYLNDFVPAIFARTYWDMIFKTTGYSYNWPDIDKSTIRFSDLLMPYSDGKIKQTQADIDLVRTTAHNFNHELSEWLETMPEDGSNFEWEDLPTPIVEFGAEHFNVSLAQYNTPIAGEPGMLGVKIKLKYRIVIENHDIWPVYLRSITDSGFITPDDPWTKTTDLGNRVGSSGAVVFGIRLAIKKMYNGNKHERYVNNLAELTTGHDSQYFEYGSSIPALGELELVNETYNDIIYTEELFNAGEGFRLQIIPAIATRNVSSGYIMPQWVNKFYGESATSADIRDTTVKVIVDDIQIDYVPHPDHLGYGTTMQLNKVIPKIKQRDYIKGIMTMFNLYAEEDEMNSNQINIYSRDDFYDKGNIKDWTRKLVIDMDRRSSFTDEYINKEFEFAYKEGKDPLNVGYQDSVKETYGSLRYTFEDENLVGTKRFEIPWQPTPLVSANDLLGTVTGFDAYPIPVNGSEPKTNPMIVYRRGVEAVEPYSIYERSELASVNTEEAIIIPMTKYLYCGHVDDPVKPSYDLNFGVSKYYFNNDINPTINNLYNMHYKRSIEQLENGRVLTAYFDLDETDILNLRMNDKIFVAGEYYNILEIPNYDASSYEPTEVKLITVDRETKLM